MNANRFKLTIAYDGRPFKGWQSQPSGNTIQDHLLAAARLIHPDIGPIRGSGRTDSGVHAIGQVAHFDAPAELSLDSDAWVRALNTKLPRTIRVMSCEAASPDFHARFDAREKTYRYEIFTGPVLPPLRVGLAWHVRKIIDQQLLTDALAMFEGRHDFAAFAANRRDPDSNPEDKHRTIFSATIEAVGEDLSFVFTGDGFHYKMVRLIVGAIVKTGQGRLSLAELASLIANESNGAVKSPLAAPADGLTLVKVIYS
ncbi:MAG: tRNA pseudouridine38-40 synthase [Verrucomicrobiales bacterium]|jgi:tRNA pseudouridine38-40 synthase